MWLKHPLLARVLFLKSPEGKIKFPLIKILPLFEISSLEPILESSLLITFYQLNGTQQMLAKTNG